MGANEVFEHKDPPLTSCAFLSLKVQHLGMDAAREASNKRRNEVKFEPKSNKDVKGPKKGREDPNKEEHTGGGTWAGGVSDFFKYKLHTLRLLHNQTGGRDTAGLGGKGGYMRLYQGHEIKQVIEAQSFECTIPPFIHLSADIR